MIDTYFFNPNNIESSCMILSKFLNLCAIWTHNVNIAIDSGIKFVMKDCSIGYKSHGFNFQEMSSRDAGCHGQKRQKWNEGFWIQTTLQQYGDAMNIDRFCVINVKSVE